MLGILLIALAASQVTLAQDQQNLHEICRGPPPGVERPQDCCKIPPFFPDEDFAECGFEKIENSPGHHRRGPPDCSKQLCMMKKYNLLNEDQTINSEALGGFMDKYAETNPAFKDAVKTAKDRCVGKQLPGPPHICEANKLVFCISSTLFSDCPVWESTEGCKTLKDHMQLCKPLFHRP